MADFATQEKLSVRLKYDSNDWHWMNYNPENTEAKKFKEDAMRLSGALNVIDNTRQIPAASAKAGDLIMTRWNSTLGHTRIIHSISHEKKSNKYKIIWYQGNLPPVKPEKNQIISR